MVLYLNDKSLLTEIPLIIDTSKYTSNDVCEKCDDAKSAANTTYASDVEEEDIEVTQNTKQDKNYYNRPKTVFVPDALDKKKK